ncbi:MAG TPA: Type 1 glutamine amidotransferase-like domain-containing protein [Fimbriimonas sp.]|nr:Type 1 glutamine amidotransferase-like domain-containing protein [Fimbriimonas sp.]
MRIVAIGGGSVGEGQTLRMDEELIRLSGAGTPRLLFIPTASDDAAEYVDIVFGAFQKLGCKTEVLLLWGPDGAAEAEKLISEADIVYVGGGNTKKMVARWQEMGVDRMLKAHLDQGKPVGGVSAGAICWFRVGNSDWPQYEGIPEVNTARLDCLGFIDLVVCPHTKCETFRLGEFREMMKTERGVGIGIDDWCALQIEGDRYRILASQPHAVAHRIEWVGGTLHERILEPHEDFRLLADLRAR